MLGFSQFQISGRLLLLASAFSFGFATNALANHKNAVLGEVQVAGSGCQNGTVSTRLDRRTGHFIVAPGNYAAIIENNASVSRKSCSFSIPFKAPANRAVRIRYPRIVGEVVLDGKAQAQVNYEIFFAGLRGNSESLNFHGQPELLEKNFDHITQDQVIYECGKDGIIRGNSSILVKNPELSSQIALVHVQKFGIKIDTVPCH